MTERTTTERERFTEAYQEIANSKTIRQSTIVIEGIGIIDLKRREHSSIVRCYIDTDGGGEIGYSDLMRLIDRADRNILRAKGLYI